MSYISEDEIDINEEYDEYFGDCDDDTFEKFVDEIPTNKINLSFNDKQFKISTNRFGGLKLMNHTLELKKNTRINLCIYNIIKKLNIPFIGYYLQANVKTGYEFPYVNIEHTSHIYENIKSILQDNVEKYVTGYFSYENQLYLFIDISENKNKRKLAMHYDLIFVDELINSKKRYNKVISNEVCDFFFENIEFTRIYNIDDKLYETPVVLYTDLYDNESRFCLAFNKLRSSKNKIFGPSYYFTTYNGCVHKIKQKQTQKHNYRVKNNYISRVVVFLGKQKILLNYPNDDIDLSDYKKDVLLYTNTTTTTNRNNIFMDEYNERMTMRISDYDAEWMNKYDSIYVGKLKLDDSSYNHEYPVWCSKCSSYFKIIDIEKYV